MSVAHTKTCKVVAMYNFNIHGSINVSSLTPTVHWTLNKHKSDNTERKK